MKGLFIAYRNILMFRLRTMFIACISNINDKIAHNFNPYNCCLINFVLTFVLLSNLVKKIMFLDLDYRRRGLGCIIIMMNQPIIGFICQMLKYLRVYANYILTIVIGGQCNLNIWLIHKDMLAKLFYIT